MSRRARTFVESWIGQYVHPASYESKDRHAESRANAVACYHSALIEGISKEEISEEFDDLVTHMANQHEQIIDKEIDRLVRRDN